MRDPLRTRSRSFPHQLAMGAFRAPLTSHLGSTSVAPIPSEIKAGPLAQEEQIATGESRSDSLLPERERQQPGPKKVSPKSMEPFPGRPLKHTPITVTSPMVTCPVQDQTSTHFPSREAGVAAVSTGFKQQPPIPSGIVTGTKEKTHAVVPSEIKSDHLAQRKQTAPGESRSDSVHPGRELERSGPTTVSLKSMEPFPGKPLKHTHITVTSPMVTRPVQDQVAPRFPSREPGMTPVPPLGVKQQPPIFSRMVTETEEPRVTIPPEIKSGRFVQRGQGANGESGPGTLLPERERQRPGPKTASPKSMEPFLGRPLQHTPITVTSPMVTRLVQDQTSTHFPSREAGVAAVSTGFKQQPPTPSGKAIETEEPRVTIPPEIKSGRFVQRGQGANGESGPGTLLPERKHQRPGPKTASPKSMEPFPGKPLKHTPMTVTSPMVIRLVQDQASPPFPSRRSEAIGRQKPYGFDVGTNGSKIDTQNRAGPRHLEPSRIHAQNIGFNNRDGILKHFTPLKVALDELKNSVARIERSEAKGSNHADHSWPDNLSDHRHIARSSQKTDIDIRYLSEELYRMLERKIMIERERRGW